VDLGDPVSYLALDAGTPVFASDGREIGRVRQVIVDIGADIFEGIVVDLQDGGQAFAEGDDTVLAMHRRGVVLSVDAEGARALPDPADR
jgi:sporulation protein YlmC with PRC-barrel domain